MIKSVGSVLTDSSTNLKYKTFSCVCSFSCGSYEHSACQSQVLLSLFIAAVPPSEGCAGPPSGPIDLLGHRGKLYQLLCDSDVQADEFRLVLVET